MHEKLMTVGQLARRTGVPASSLRYYEKQNLLAPAGHTEAGYRLYGAKGEQTVEFIKKAKRYGFSLDDIRIILGSDSGEDSKDAEILSMAERRFVDIERRVTDMLVLRHELELFLNDLAVQLRRTVKKRRHYRDLLEQICGHDVSHMPSSSFQQLAVRIGCNLANSEWEELYSDLRGKHIHIWRNADEYSVQFLSKSPKIEAALNRLADSEANCDVHLQSEVHKSDDGLQFKAKGPNAFLYAKLFLALEAART